MTNEIFRRKGETSRILCPLMTSPVQSGITNIFLFLTLVWRHSLLSLAVPPLAGVHCLHVHTKGYVTVARGGGDGRVVNERGGGGGGGGVAVCLGVSVPPGQTRLSCSPRSVSLLYRGVGFNCLAFTAATSA